MRVTQASDQTQFLSALDTLESNISQTQNQISTGLAFTTPSQNPSAAGEVDNFQQVLAQSQQYTANANAAQTGLNTEDTALTQVQTQLQSLRDLALQANSGTASNQNLSAIATQAQQIQASLLSLANTQDGNGNYIFSGFASQTQPFALTATGASYAGDQGQPQVQIAAGQTVASGDNGDAVFNQIKTGNGTFAVAANAANTGSGLIGATTVSNPTLYTGGSYSINFTAPNTYQVVNSVTSAVVTSGTYASGTAIAFDGLQVSLSGQPATGDSFAVTPSTNQSIFTTVQTLVSALQTGVSTPASQTQFSNMIAGTLNNLDQALTHSSTVQAAVGGRLNAITTQLSVATSQQAQLTQSISSLQGLNYATAITTLDSQNTTLSAAMQAFTLTQGLTLFKYIS
ncbi:MAG: flagellar hook-associated protein FlgL [Steroidobacteraceae bacterium]